jgi:hypothetical protein
MAADNQMLVFEFLLRSELARKGLEPFRVRIWDQRAWGFWRPEKGVYTRNPAEAEIFDFRRAWEIASEEKAPRDILFDPVNLPEPTEVFISRWQNLKVSH